MHVGIAGFQMSMQFLEFSRALIFSEKTEYGPWSHRASQMLSHRIRVNFEFRKSLNLELL